MRLTGYLHTSPPHFPLPTPSHSLSHPAVTRLPPPPPPPFLSLRIRSSSSRCCSAAQATLVRASPHTPTTRTATATHSSPPGVDVLVNSTDATVAIRTQPGLQMLEGALNAFQATFRLTSTSHPLFLDVDMLVVLQRARAVPTRPNASSTTAAVSTSAASRVTVLTGQIHTATWRSASALNDALSFDFTGNTACNPPPPPPPPSPPHLPQGLPSSCSIAPVRRLSTTEWSITVTWPVCNSDLGTVSLAMPCSPPLHLTQSPTTLSFTHLTHTHSFFFASPSNSCVPLPEAPVAASAQPPAWPTSSSRTNPPHSSRPQQTKLSLSAERKHCDCISATATRSTL